ncbi:MULTISPECIES: porin [Thermomonas]|jgi:cell division protein FtsB|uniref:Carbohydrate porin n=1 Tax=Thermomonas beijingensis TaxID=2872701 RepID=A0ABS7TEP3_9GAMM|nr:MULTISPECIES: porin [Thermomonas]MBS0459711.1 carbohydrate porin [Pseudomonadota bacterium]MDE2382569.1 carbohydrate porin [Xanthomonadaceae bacterium]MBZ4186226.1 carbohydrate porin [Thermomonas beijingensis]HOC10000.1 porin [Thermomonas sp.]HQA00931.1 porin [Thermomonas sp.]
MRTTRLAAAIVLIAAGNMSFNAAAQSAPSAKDIAEMKAQIAALQAQIQSLEDRSQDLEARSDAQSDVNVEQAKANESLATIDSLKKLVNDTKLSGRLYYDLTNINDSSKGVKTDKSGFAFDIKRFYLGVDHKFNDQWSMNLTTDFQYSSAISSTEVYLKKAYIQYKLSDAFVLRAGAADLPWVPFAENYYGMRYIENTLTDRLKFGTSADWGVHAGGKLAGGAVEYAVAALNGNGYKNPSRSKGLDFEGRLSFAPTEQTVIGVGAYSGTLGKEKQTVNALHTANRVDFLAAYMSGNTRLGVEYFQANNWNNVTSVASDKASGWSLWGSVGLNDKGVTLFGRYDNTDVSKTLDPSLQDRYYNIGVEWPVAPGVKLATVYKHTDQRNTLRSKDLKTDEFGVWGEFRF